METRKQRILDTLNAWANQRPGLEPRDYTDGTMEGWRGYRREAAHITKDLQDYRALSAAVSWRDSITADHLAEAFPRAWSGRLSMTEDGEKVTLDYCVGQYWPTEYRRAACSVLASVLWRHFATDCPQEYGDDPSPGQWTRNEARKNLGQGIQRGWFN